MFRQVIFSILTFCAVGLAFAVPVSAQTSSQIEETVTGPNTSWSFAQSASSSNRTVFVYTLDQPDRRHTCHIRTFTVDKLVCSRAMGTPRTYLPQKVLALVIPGDDALRRWWLIGLNTGLGASIWGTVVLAGTCPVCAAATSLAALIFFGSAGATIFVDGQPERIVYLADGHQMTGKLRFVGY